MNKKQARSDEEQLDELLVALQQKFLSGEPRPKSNQKKTKEELDDEKFQAQLAAMLGNLSASSAKIKKSKKKATPPSVEVPLAEEQPTVIDTPSTVGKPILKEPTPTLTAPTEKKPRRKSSRPKKPITEEPTVEEPTVEEPTVEEPTVEESTVEEPTVEEPTVEEPTVEEPTVEEPTVEEPTVEEPTVEEPTVEEPIVEEPIVEEPTVEKPTVEKPINSVPIVIKPRVRVEPYEPQKPDADAIRITSPTRPISDEPIRIVPRHRADVQPRSSRHSDAIVIRPKAYPTPQSEPIVIRPRVVEKARPIPQKQNPAPTAQPIKIGKEKSNDPDA